MENSNKIYKKGTKIIEAMVGNYITVYVQEKDFGVVSTKEFMLMIKMEGYEQLN